MAIETLPRFKSEELRRQRLVVTRRWAGALLGFTTVVFAVTTIVGADGWLGYVQATAEASMVGGLADWFAVTALFRRPLGLPIPHTAIIPERKDQFGETLGEFIQDSFLTPDSIVARVTAAHGSPSGWRRGCASPRTRSASPVTSPTARSRSPISSRTKRCTPRSRRSPRATGSCATRAARRARAARSPRSIDTTS